MEGSWNHGRAHYRCRLKPADTRSGARRSGHPRAAYVREDKVVDRIDSWLEDLFAPTRREHTITLLHEADPHSAWPLSGQP